MASVELVLVEPLAVALHGITRSGAAPGDRVMVIGAGPIGALTIAALVARGIGPVIAVEPGERRRQLAAALGASEVLDPTDLETFPPWEPERITERATHVVLEDALALLGSGRLPTDLLIESEDVPLHGLSEALAGLADGRLAGKVMVAPRLSAAAATAPPRHPPEEDR